MWFDLILMMRDIYINSNLNPLTNFTSSSRSTEFSHDHEEHPNKHNNSKKPHNGMAHPIWSLWESQWKMRQQHDQNFPMKGKPTNTSIRRKKEIQKGRTVIVCTPFLLKWGVNLQPNFQKGGGT